MPFLCQRTTSHLALTRLVTAHSTPNRSLGSGRNAWSVRALPVIFAIIIIIALVISDIYLVRMTSKLIKIIDF